jgi:hypothetical protein
MLDSFGTRRVLELIHIHFCVFNPEKSLGCSTQWNNSFHHMNFRGSRLPDEEDIARKDELPCLVMMILMNLEAGEHLLPICVLIYQKSMVLAEGTSA